MKNSMTKKKNRNFYTLKSDFNSKSLKGIKNMSIDKEANYWDAGGIETMDYLRAKLTPEQFKGFLLGSLLKYPSRSNFKGCFRRDIEKSGIYSKLLLELPEKKEEDKNIIKIHKDNLDKLILYCLKQEPNNTYNRSYIIDNFVNIGKG